MINMPLFKCLLAALSVLSCVGAVAPSTTPEVAFDAAKMNPEMSGGRALGTAAAPTPKDCTELNNENTCTKIDKKSVTKKCRKPRLCRKMCRKNYRKTNNGKSFFC